MVKIAALVNVSAVALVRTATPSGDAPTHPGGIQPEPTGTLLRLQLDATAPAMAPTQTDVATSEQSCPPGNRDLPGICVQTATAASLTDEAARERVAAVFEQVAWADDWPGVADRDRTEFDAGCSAAGALLGPEHSAKSDSKGLDREADHTVDDPIPCPICVMVRSEDEVRVMFGIVSLRAQTQEMLVTRADSAGASRLARIWVNGNWTTRHPSPTGSAGHSGLCRLLCQLTPGSMRGSPGPRRWCQMMTPRQRQHRGTVEYRRMRNNRATPTGAALSASCVAAW